MPLSSFWRPSGVTYRSASDPIVFIKYVNGRDTATNELWSDVLDGLCHNVHPKEQVDIPPINVGEFITNFLTVDKRRIQIIGQESVNGSVQFSGFTEAYGSSLLFNSNSAIPVEDIGWGGTARNNTSYPATFSWGKNINSSPDNSLRSPVLSHVAMSRNRNNFLHHRRIECLWCLYSRNAGFHTQFIVCNNAWFLSRNQNRELMSDSENLLAQ